MTTTSQLFQGKVVLVTGGSSGIGLATARAFAREGARVIIAPNKWVAPTPEGDGKVRALASSTPAATVVDAEHL